MIYRNTTRVYGSFRLLISIRYQYCCFSYSSRTYLLFLGKRTQGFGPKQARLRSARSRQNVLVVGVADGIGYLYGIY